MIFNSFPQGKLQPGAALHDAPIREDGGRRDVARAFAGQKSDHTADFLRLSHATHRDGGVEFLHQRRILHRRKIDGSRHCTGTDADDEDVMWRKFDPRGARKHSHSALRQTVGGITGHWPILMYRGDVDDVAPTALLDHLPGGKLGAEKRALEVDREHLVKLFFRSVKHASAGLDAG